MAETLSTLSTVSFVIAVVFLIVSVYLFFLFRIPTIIGDLTGRNARKSIEKIRAANEKSGAKSYRESSINAERGKLTEPVSVFATPKKQAQSANTSQDRPETGLLIENRDTDPTSERTQVLDPETTTLLVDNDATASLDRVLKKRAKRAGGQKLKMIDEVLLIHTDEVVG